MLKRGAAFQRSSPDRFARQKTTRLSRLSTRRDDFRFVMSFCAFYSRPSLGHQSSEHAGQRFFTSVAVSR